MLGCWVREYEGREAEGVMRKELVYYLWGLEGRVIQNFLMVVVVMQ